jgi:hypothetical protein
MAQPGSSVIAGAYASADRAELSPGEVPSGVAKSASAAERSAPSLEEMSDAIVDSKGV